MRIQLMGFGLANQIRMYVFARFGERRCPDETWLFDDSWFFFAKVPGRDYQLERVFGLKLKRMSRYYDVDTWNRILEQRKKGVSMPQILSDMGTPVALATDWPTYGSFDGTIIDVLGFDPSIVELPYENVYYHGFWAGKKWFQSYEEDNRRELKFPELTDKRNLDYADSIRSCTSVGIHVRRGDFTVLGWDVPKEWYRAACERVIERHPDAKFFVFSDDLPWCKANAEELGFNLPWQKTTYIDGNSGEQSYVDMQLLSMCKGMVRSRDSSFSQVAGWLNRNLEFEIRFKSLQDKNKENVARNYRDDDARTYKFLCGGKLSQTKI